MLYFTVALPRVVCVVVVVFNLITFSCCSFSCNGNRGCALLPPDGQCGKVRPDPRIVGGQDAQLGQFPWAALIYASSSSPSPKRRGRRLKELLSDRLQKRRDRRLKRLKLLGVIRGKRKVTRVSRTDKRPICGGSIINDRFIVTAAHCCQLSQDISIVSVTVGEYDLESTVDCYAGTCAPPSQDIPVEKYVVHEGFDAVFLSHDICLIKLQSPIKYNDFVGPICLPITEDLQNKNLSGTYLEVAGWGIKEFENGKEVKASVLQTTSLPYVTLDECQRELGDTVMNSPKLCVGGGGNQDSCGGDSGGPLMGKFSGVTGSAPLYYLMGIVSYGDPKCDGSVPGVYVDILKYLGWIINTMENMT